MRKDRTMLPDRAARGFSQPPQQQAVQAPSTTGLGQGCHQSRYGEQHIGPYPLMAAEISQEQVEEETVLRRRQPKA